MGVTHTYRRVLAGARSSAATRIPDRTRSPTRSLVPIANKAVFAAVRSAC